jgi:hypothetical protein
MPKAGLFAGEITEQAPADGATTTKQKGYQWLEYGNIFEPQAYDVSGGEGWCVTQNGFSPGTDFPYPFEDINATEWTMMAVFTPIDLALPGQGAVIIDTGQWANAPFISCARRSVSNQRFMSIGFGGDNSPSSNEIGVGKVELTLNYPTWLNSHWYCMAMSYSQPLNRLTFMCRNLTLGEEMAYNPFISSNHNVKYPTSPTVGTSNSVAAYASQANVPAGAPDTPFLGQLSQVWIDDSWLDLTIGANRNKFCGSDGVIFIGEDGSSVTGSRPLYYTPSGVPFDNAGTLNVGLSPDYWAKGTFTPATNLPPEAS